MTTYVLVALFSFLSGCAVAGYVGYRYGARATKLIQAVENATQNTP